MLITVIFSPSSLCFYSALFLTVSLVSILLQSPSVPLRKFQLKGAYIPGFLTIHLLFKQGIPCQTLHAGFLIPLFLQSWYMIFGNISGWRNYSNHMNFQPQPCLFHHFFPFISLLTLPSYLSSFASALPVSFSWNLIKSI